MTHRGHSDDLFVISLNDFRWHRPQTMGHGPSNRAFHGASIVSQKNLIIFGGLETVINGKNLRKNVLNDIYILDMQDMH